MMPSLTQALSLSWLHAFGYRATALPSLRATPSPFSYSSPRFSQPVSSPSPQSLVKVAASIARPLAQAKGRGLVAWHASALGELVRQGQATLVVTAVATLSEDFHRPRLVLGDPAPSVQHMAKTGAAAQVSGFTGPLIKGHRERLVLIHARSTGV